MGDKKNRSGINFTLMEYYITIITIYIYITIINVNLNYYILYNLHEWNLLYIWDEIWVCMGMHCMGGMHIQVNGFV